MRGGSRERHRANAAATLTGGSCRGTCGGLETMFAEVGCVGKPGRIAGHHADAGTTVATTCHLLDAAIVETRRRRPLVFGIHLGEVSTAAHGAS